VSCFLRHSVYIYIEAACQHNPSSGHFGTKTVRHCSDVSDVSRHFGTSAAVYKRHFGPDLVPNCLAPSHHHHHIEWTDAGLLASVSHE